MHVTLQNSFKLLKKKCNIYLKSIFLRSSDLRHLQKIMKDNRIVNKHSEDIPYNTMI